MTERELIDDLNLAWCVELRAPEPYCPIDLSYEDGEISISQAESIARPLRLAADEASALLVALRMLAEARRRRRCRRPADREDRGRGGRRGRRRAPRWPSRSSTRTRAGWPPRSTPPWPRASGSTCATTCPAATRRPSGTWTRCGCSSWRAGPTWRAGAAAPRASGSSGSTGCCRSTCSTSRRGAGGGGASGRGRRAVHRVAVGRARRARARRRPARWVAEYYPCESVTELADGRLRIALRTPDTAVGPPPGAAPRRGRPGGVARRRWRTRSAPPPRRPWPCTSTRPARAAAGAGLGYLRATRKNCLPSSRHSGGVRR